MFSEVLAQEKEPAFPKRPELPLPLLVLGTFLAGAALIVGEVVPLYTVILMAGVFSVGTLATVGVIRRILSLRQTATIEHVDAMQKSMPSTWWIVLAVTALICGSILAQLACGRIHAQEQVLASYTVSRLVCELETDALPAKTGWQAKGKVFTHEGKFLGRMWLSLPLQLHKGMRINGVGRIKLNGNDEWSSICRRMGLAGSITYKLIQDKSYPQDVTSIIYQVRENLLRAYKEHFGNKSALLSASICGDTTAMKEEGYDTLFSASGVSHLTAVSGSHLALIATMLGALLSKFKCRPTLRILVLVCFCGLFVIFSGAAASAVRSWLMTICACGSQLLGRRGHAASATSVVGIGMLVQNPHLSWDLGFLLSLCSVLALCLYAAYVTYYVRKVSACLPRVSLIKLPKKIKDMVGSGSDIVAATLVCQLACTPLTISTFHEMSLVSLPANLLLSLPFSFMLFVGLVGALFYWATPIFCLLSFVAHSLGDICVLFLRLLTRMPITVVGMYLDFLPVAVLVGVVFVVWYILWPRLHLRRLGVMAAATLVFGLCTFVTLQLTTPASLEVLDVGQGDAILIREGPCAVLVDAGPDDAVVARLAEAGVFHLNAVIITHQHDDHFAGLEYMAQKIAVDRIYVARGGLQNTNQELLKYARTLCGTNKPLRELSFGDTLAFGNFTMKVVWPSKEVEGKENKDSIELLVLYAQRDKTLTALLCGDAEKDETLSMQKLQRIPNLDILKLGHHGSKISITKEQVQQLDPEFCFASASEDNSYGHPTQECIEAVKAAESQFMCTKDEGTIKAYPAQNGVRITTSKQTGFLSSFGWW